jgi:hypothetical protein
MNSSGLLARLRPDMSAGQKIPEGSVDPGWEFVVDGHRLHIFDGLLPDVAAYVRALSYQPRHTPAIKFQRRGVDGN